jgi:hypothetical protein
MAILTLSAMLVSSFAALSLLPTLILTLRPRFIFGKVKAAKAADQLASSGG